MGTRSQLITSTLRVDRRFSTLTSSRRPCRIQSVVEGSLTLQIKSALTSSSLMAISLIKKSRRATNWHQPQAVHFKSRVKLLWQYRRMRPDLFWGDFPTKRPMFLPALSILSIRFNRSYLEERAHDWRYLV